MGKERSWRGSQSNPSFLDITLRAWLGSASLPHLPYLMSTSHYVPMISAALAGCAFLAQFYF